MNLNFFALFCLIFFCSGCIEEVSIEDRLACLELTSFSFTTVPKCTSQEACFKEVDSAFSFDTSVFELEVRGELFSAKNRLARIWLFLNKARGNLESIHDICYSSDNFSSVPREVNELNSNLIIVGEEIDLFNESAVKTISFELDSLEENDVNNIREEFLFEDYIILNQNVIDFSQKNLLNKTFASRFLLEVEKFSSFAKALDLQSTIHETSVLSIISENSSSLTKPVAKRDFPISLVAPIFSGISDYLFSFLTKGSSVSSLKNIPSFELFSAINSIAGRENSAVYEFFSIFVNESSHKKTIEVNNEVVKENISSQLIIADAKFNEIIEKYGESSLPNFSSTENATISSLDFSTRSLDSFSNSFSSKIAMLKSELYSIEESDFLGVLSLGKKTMRLKNLLNSSINLIEELEQVDGIFSSSIIECNFEVLIIKEKISTPEFSSSTPTIVSLVSRLKNKISFFESTQNLGSCSAVINTFDELYELLDSSVPEAQVSVLIQECFVHCEKLLILDESNEFVEKINSLKRILQPYSNSDLVLSSCNAIKQALESKLVYSPDSVLVSEYFTSLSENISLLRCFNENFSVSSTNSIFSDFDSLSVNFSKNMLKIDSLSTSSSILSKTRKLLEESKVQVKTIVSEALLKDLVFEEFSNSLVKFSFNNPCSEVNGQFFTSPKLNLVYAEKVFSTTNISLNSKDNKLEFSSLLQGVNSIILDLNGTKQPIEIIQKTNLSSTAFEKTKILFEKNNLVEESNEKNPKSKSEVEFFAKKIDFFTDLNKLDLASEELKKLSLFVNSQKSNDSFKSSALSYLEKLSKISSLKKSIAETITILESNFAELSSSEFNEISGFIPISTQRISELKELSQKPIFPVSEFSKLLDNNEFEQAVVFAEKNNFDSLIKELEFAEKEASSALNTLKENSLSSYNVAVNKRKSSTSPELDSLLLNSRGAIEKKNYASSLLNSNRAVNLTGMASIPIALDIPLPVYPLILVIFGVAFYVYKKTAEEKKPKKLIKIKKIS